MPCTTGFAVRVTTGMLEFNFLKMIAPRTNHVDDVGVTSGHFGCQCFGIGLILLSTVSFDREVLSLDMPQPTKFIE
jgi:hypothetical protein